MKKHTLFLKTSFAAGLLMLSSGLQHLYAQNSFLVVPSGGSAPSGTQTTTMYQNSYFMGIGTTDPNGPLEVVDQPSLSTATPDVANIVVTEINNPNVYCQQSCVGCLPVPDCSPRYALALRSKNYNFNGAFTGYTNKMVLTRNGNIGINADPSANSGLTLADRSIDILRRSTAYTTYSPPKGINFRDATNVVNHTITTDANNVLTITPGADGSSSNVLQITGNQSTSGDATVAGTVKAQKIIVGTQAPVGNYSGYMLGVDGDIVGRKLIAETSDWADYVFAPDYQLRPLTDVAGFIAANHHLPDVPTTEEVKKNGVDLGEMNAKLLRKVEELTLYVLQQQKEIDALKNKPARQ